jgi:predicted acyl esterase
MPDTEIRDGMRIDWDAPIEMDDGVVLRADVYRPVEDGSYPVIMTYGPYAKGLHFADGYADAWRVMCENHPDVPANSTNQYQSWEVVDPEKWVPEGYVCVRVDSRGAGRSPGVIDCFSPREARDFHDCIEWGGVQPWSNGKVGLCGISYYAITQWLVAALQPPHLAAIVPWEGANDWYRDGMYHGGIRCTFGANWYPNQVSTVQNGLGERAKKSRVTGLSVAGDVTLSDEELKANQVDFGQMIRDHPFDDEFHAGRRADLAKVTVPLLSAGNWGGHGLHLRGNQEGFLRAASDQKWLQIHGLEHWTHFYTDYGRELQLEFLDHFLKGEDNGWDRRPPVLLNVRNVDETFVLREEEAWPIPRTRWTEFYLDASSMSLSLTPPERATTTYQGMGEGATFTMVVEEELEITGPSAAKLRVSSSTEDADLFLLLRVFAPDGKEVTFLGSVQSDMPVAHGWLRASHRKLDAERSEPWRPWHPHKEREPLTPGEAVAVDVEILATSIVIPVGYTLAVTVQGVDYEPSTDAEENMIGWLSMRGVGPFRHDDPEDRPTDVFDGNITLHTGGADAAHVLLPVIPPKA